MAQKGPVKQTPVDSTCLSIVRYDAQKQQLDLTFRNSGAVYRYFGVDNNTYGGLMEAESRGRYFVNNIRMSYHYQRIQ